MPVPMPESTAFIPSTSSVRRTSSQTNPRINIGSSSRFSTFCIILKLRSRRLEGASA